MSNAFDKASLVMLPHAYEEGKVYSLKPTDRSGDFTFSRGTDTATRVGEDGYIKKEYANLFLQSNTFSDTAWTKSSASVTGGQAGYDGTNDAWLLSKLTTGGYIISNTSSVTGVTTFSCYAKADSLNYFRIDVGKNTGYSISYFDLTGNGAIGGSGNSISSSIENVGNGWFRCSVSVEGNVSYILLIPADTISSQATTGSVYIQDAQVNQGLVAYPYLETTTSPVYGGLTDDMPRLDYSGGATCPSLLLEPSRTNSLEHSEYLNSSQYNKLNTTVIDDNVAVSPEGLQNASKIKSGSSTLTSIGFENTSIASQYRTFSMFAKAGEIEEILIFGVQVAQGVFFNLNDGTISGYYQGNSSQITDAYSVNYGNGWYRYTVIFASNSRPRIFNSLSQQITFTQTTGNGYYAYGLQTEDASYPTSYIPTYGSSQTRAADLATNTGMIDADNDFTFYFECDKIPDAAGQYIDFTGNLGYLSSYSGSRIRWRYVGSNLSSPINEGVFKWLIRKDSVNIKMYLNGELKHTKEIPSGLINLNLKGGSVHKTLYFPTALSDSECIALTTV